MSKLKILFMGTPDFSVNILKGLTIMVSPFSLFKLNGYF